MAWVDGTVIEKIMPGASYLDFYDKIDMDAVPVGEDIGYVTVDTDTKKDHFGILRDFTQVHRLSWPMPLGPVIPRDEDPNEVLDKYVPPDPDDPKRLETLRAAVERFAGKKAVVFEMFNSFLFPAYIRGFNEFLMDCVLNPDLVRRIVKIVVDYYVRLEKHATEIGADGYSDNASAAVALARSLTS